MKIVHVITGLQKAAGTTTFVENVVRELCARGHEAEVATSADGFTRCDVMHIHGLWSGLLHKAGAFAAARGIPVVWSTHGMTAPWSMRWKRWKKLPAWWLYQRRDLRRAAAIHCTTAQELEWNRRLGFERCFVVPLGTGEVASGGSGAARAEGVRRLLFVGRIYPVKGLVNLVRAWGLVAERLGAGMQGWQLRIVGPDQAGHQECLKAEVRALRLDGMVEFAGPKYGEELSREYADCDCLVLPSFTENFGGVVIDALAHGKPCIASSSTPWRELRDCGCGWWVSNEPEPLADAIGEMIGVGDIRRREMGEKGRALAEDKYSWPAVADSLAAHYGRIVAAALPGAAIGGDRG